MFSWGGGVQIREGGSKSASGYGPGRSKSAVTPAKAIEINVFQATLQTPSGSHKCILEVIGCDRVPHDIASTLENKILRLTPREFVEIE